jgi:hypothetical protein
MPPWRKGRGLGPFTSARPAAGPLLSSQLVWPQTTQNSRPLGDPGHANEHLWSVARPLPGRRCSPFRLTWAHQPVGQGWPYWALSGTAVAVVQSLEGSIDAPTPGPDVDARPAATHVGWESMHRQLSAASPSEPRDRPSGSGVGPGSSVSRGVAARLRRCGHTGWNTARRFGAGFGGYSSDAGNKPSRQRDQVLVLHSRRLPGNRSAPVLPLHSAFGMRSSARQRLRGLPASVPYGTASAHRHPARVWHPERH